MTGLSSKHFSTGSPSQADVVLATESSQRLASHSIGHKGSVQVQLLDESIAAPASAVRLFLQVLAEMSKGRGVTLIPKDSELTAQEAADLLNVSRPYLYRLLDEGQIPFSDKGIERTVQLNDLMAYKAKDDEVRARIAIELTQDAQELQMGY